MGVPYPFPPDFNSSDLAASSGVFSEEEAPTEQVETQPEDAPSTPSEEA